MVNSSKAKQLENLQKTSNDLNDQSTNLDIPQNKPLEFSDKLEQLNSTLKNSKDLIAKSTENLESAPLATPVYSLVIIKIIGEAGEGVRDSFITDNPKVQESFNNKDKADKALISGQDQLINLQKLIENLKGSGTPNFLPWKENITQLLLEYQELISSFSLIPKLTFTNMLTGVLVLNSLFTIVVIFYGESLINYLKLETKLPRLAKFIKYRTKLQQYYFLLNILIIICAIVIMIYANYLMFLSS